MADLPAPENQIIERFGPHAAYVPVGGWGAASDPDRRVPSHCCFCGQQCGMILLVKDNVIVGLEPWEEFPFNHGMLCPKGVNRYLQSGHPDRLRAPLVRAPNGFQETTWDDALDRVARAVRQIQAEHGRDAFAMLSGASLITEKAYLAGKFARLALKTRNIDYNGRLCMVSAAAASKKAFGIDRSANPWSDILLAECILIAGSNTAECSPITTDYVWRARDSGAHVIVVDPRLTPIARTADVYLPVRPGRDAALLNGMLHVLIQEDLLDHTFIRERTTGFEQVKEAVSHYPPAVAAEIAGVHAEDLVRAARLWGEAKTSFALHARGIEHHIQGVENCAAVINLVLATGRIGRPGCGYGTITGQGNGQGGREHGQKCDQLPGMRDIEDPAAREYIARVWGVHPDEIPHQGLTAVEIFEAIDRSEIRGLLSISFNPLVSLPDAGFIRNCLRKLDFYCAIDFFLSETARHADVVLAGSTQEEEEGIVTSVEGRVIHIRQAVEPPGQARQDTRILCDLAERLGAGDKFRFRSTREILDELRVASRGGLADYYGITYEKIDRQMGVFWPCPELDHPGTPRLFEDGRFYTGDGRAHFIPVTWHPPAEDTDEEYPIVLTSGRVVAHYLSGNQTRRIGPLLDQTPNPYVEIHPQLAAQLGVADGEPVRITSRRGSIVLPASVVTTIRPDTVFIPYHWGGRQSVNILTIRALDPVSKIPEYKICAVKLEKAAAGAVPAAEIASLSPRHHV
ncbi:MAG: molybdopterin oxidoreductase family protein [Armatimonadetes bacterium]|nr:molybdopterin oxidoreductase family protein [Armatimonadota bacterium]